MLVVSVLAGENQDLQGPDVIDYVRWDNDTVCSHKLPPTPLHSNYTIYNTNYIIHFYVSRLPSRLLSVINSNDCLCVCMCVCECPCVIPGRSPLRKPGHPEPLGGGRQRGLHEVDGWSCTGQLTWASARGVTPPRDAFPRRAQTRGETKPWAWAVIGSKRFWISAYSKYGHSVGRKSGDDVYSVTLSPWQRIGERFLMLCGVWSSFGLLTAVKVSGCFKRAFYLSIDEQKKASVAIKMNWICYTIKAFKLKWQCVCQNPVHQSKWY